MRKHSNSRRAMLRLFVCPSVTSRYCINMAEPTLKLVRLSDSSITIVFCDVEIGAKFMGSSSQGLEYTGYNSTETVQDRTVVTIEQYQ